MTARHFRGGSRPSPLRPRLTKTVHGVVDWWIRLGEQTAFYVKAIRNIPKAVVNYTEELLAVIAQLALGVGALALIGGAVVVVSFVTGNISTVVGFIGKVNLDRIGVFALAGFFSAYAMPRIVTVITVSFGLAATVGAGTTARLGAMRINEEIDALEVMGISAMTYLVSTRVLGGVIVAVPLGCLGELAGILVTRFMFTVSFGQSSGGYSHYFNTFLNPMDTIYALVQIALQAAVIMLIHCYYGFTASGGPAGVGEATGRAVRASLIMALVVTFVSALVLYGRSGNFHLSG